MKAHIHPDLDHPNMWRVRWPDGSYSDMVNLTRAKDAIATRPATSSASRPKTSQRRSNEAAATPTTEALS